MSKTKDLSARTVTRQGIGVPVTMFAVLALNSCKREKKIGKSARPSFSNSRVIDKATTNLAKVHRLDTLTAQGRTDGRAGTGLPGPDDELDNLIGGSASSLRHVGDCGCVVVGTWDIEAIRDAKKAHFLGFPIAGL